MKQVSSKVKKVDLQQALATACHMSIRSIDHLKFLLAQVVCSLTSDCTELNVQPLLLVFCHVLTSMLTQYYYRQT